MEGVPAFYLTQGVLGVSVVVLGFVVVYMQRKLDKRDADHAAEIKALNALMVATIKAHADDYKEMARENQETMATTGQTMALFGEKIEVAKGRR